MPSAVALVAYALAVARITTLITHDEISQPARSWLIRHFDQTSRTHRTIAYLLGSPDDDTTGCPWCMSIWVAAGTAPLLWAYPDRPWVVVPTITLAASQITGMIHTHGRQ